VGVGVKVGAEVSVGDNVAVVAWVDAEEGVAVCVDVGAIVGGG